MTARDCPCGSGARYAECCEPIHEGVRDAADPSALVRARFAAFAMKRPDFLWRTLHADHDDRRRGEPAMLLTVRDACAANRYMALRILDAKPAGSDGVARVLFAAKVFHKGREVSFVECSDFAREGLQWKYVGGEGVSCSFANVGDMTIEAFLGRAR